MMKQNYLKPPLLKIASATQLELVEAVTNTYRVYNYSFKGSLKQVTGQKEFDCYFLAKQYFNQLKQKKLQQGNHFQNQPNHQTIPLEFVQITRKKSLQIRQNPDYRVQLIQPGQRLILVWRSQYLSVFNELGDAVEDEDYLFPAIGEVIDALGQLPDLTFEAFLWNKYFIFSDLFVWKGKDLRGESFVNRYLILNSLVNDVELRYFPLFTSAELNQIDKNGKNNTKYLLFRDVRGRFDTPSFLLLN
ncbi:MAG TPA: hypothetical protein PKY82_34205 [Pyrinomonadaceae bacterium]|nr:hypothetical protein [Pyrinomonadaceae bacterium]